MTAIQTWVLDMVKIALQDLRETTDSYSQCIPPATPEQVDEAFRLAGQKAACLLIQARALECRHISGELLIKCPGQVPAIQLSGWLTERSRKLEAIAMEMAQQWPPKEDAPTANPSGLILVKN